ncbi:MAG: discoidin domain-containing protein, partial [Bacteroidia bacterium]|nr:discoidin domain-containing protein [Bacteroidia bacterium]
GIPVEVMFQNRQVKITDKQIQDWIGPLGTQVYRIGAIPEEENEPNLITDPGFESNFSYGVPASCYARVGSDRGATAFLDSRTRVSGHHSLRMVTPAYQKGMGLSFFPISLNSGQSYQFSIYAKADTISWLPGKRPTFLKRLFKKNPVENRRFMIKIGNLADYSFTPSAEWIPYSFYFTVPENSHGQVKINPYLELAGQGTAWFDQMVITEDPVISYFIDPKNGRPQINISTGTPNAILRYNLEGGKPQSSDPKYIDPIAVNRTVSVAAGIFRHNFLLTWTVQTFKAHLAVGHTPVYEKKYAPKYSAGGSMGLVDGQSGTRNYSDGKWQGFNGQDLKVIIDLDSIQTVRKVSLGFLQDISAWIFMPLKVEVEGSTDGKNFKLIGSADNQLDEHSKGAIRKDFVVEFSDETVRYIRVKATNRRICPDWHSGKGKAAFIFVDEIVVE